MNFLWVSTLLYISFPFCYVKITEILSEALTTNNKNTSKKLARLNLLNDVLHNSSSMMKNASAFPAE
jgi:hypothetical protein